MPVVKATITSDFIQLLNEGIYRFKVAGCTQTTNKRTGEPQIRWEFEVVAGPAHIGKKISRFTPLTGDMAFLTEQITACWGIRRDAKNELAFDTDHVLDKTLIAAVSTTVGKDGKVYPDWKSFNPDDGKVMPLDKPVEPAVDTNGIF